MTNEEYDAQTILTPEDFGTLAANGGFDFLAEPGGITRPLEEFLEELRLLVLDYIRHKAAGGHLKPNRKKLKSLGNAISKFLVAADDTTIRALAVELWYMDAGVDRGPPGATEIVKIVNPPRQQYLAGYRNELGHLNCFDSEGEVRPGDNADFADTVQTMLRGIAEACDLKTRPPEKGTPVHTLNRNYIPWIAQLMDESGFTDFPNSPVVGNPLIKLIRLLFPEYNSPEKAFTLIERTVYKIKRK